jgi:hypothetical protein
VVEQGFQSKELNFKCILNNYIPLYYYYEIFLSWAHTCNPSYTGGSNQEDRGSKPAQANSSKDPILKIPNTKRAGRVLKRPIQ